MDKNEYLDYRHKLVRQLLRARKREESYNKEMHNDTLSKWGYREEGRFEGVVMTYENIISDLDDEFNIPQEEEIKDIL